jgi:anti-sigma-K factor RskA
MQENSTPTPTAGVSAWWRGLSVTLALILILGCATAISMFEQLQAQIHHAEKRLSDIPQIQFVSVMSGEEGKAEILVTFSPKLKSMQVQRLTQLRENSEQSLHLWALSKDEAPILLGVLTSRYATQQIEVEPKALEGATQLGLSVESRDKGPIDGKPRQPWLFKGWWVQKAI